jgi:opacity protein-like surface antigen
MMAKRLITIFLIVTTMLIANATSGAAQSASSSPQVPQQAGAWSVAPFVGFGFSGDLDSAAGAFGVAGGYAWSPTITLEGELNILPSSENGGLVEVDSNSWSLTGNILYHFAPRAVQPYAVFGMGVGHSSVDADEVNGIPAVNTDPSSTEFVVNLGGGVERALRHNIILRGDMRYFFGGDLVPDYWRLGVGIRFALGTH